MNFHRIWSIWIFWTFLAVLLFWSVGGACEFVFVDNYLVVVCIVWISGTSWWVSACWQAMPLLWILVCMFEVFQYFPRGIFSGGISYTLWNCPSLLWYYAPFSGDCWRVSWPLSKISSIFSVVHFCSILLHWIRILRIWHKSHWYITDPVHSDVSDFLIHIFIIIRGYQMCVLLCCWHVRLWYSPVYTEN